MTYSSAQLKWKEESLLFSIGVDVPMKTEWVGKKMFIINLTGMGTLNGSLDSIAGVEARLQTEWFWVRIRVGKTVFSAQIPDRSWNTASIQRIG